MALDILLLESYLGNTLITSGKQYISYKKYFVYMY